MIKVASPFVGIPMLLISLACMASGFAAPSSLSNREWTVDDLLSVESAGEWRISPDCRWAIWVKNVPDNDKNGLIGNLFLSSLTEKKEIQLLRGSDGCNNPKWSPDGQLIAFISSRPNLKTKATKAQIWLMNPFGGEPWQLTGGGRSISVFEWADSNHIIYSAQEDPSLYEQINQNDTSRMVEDESHEPPVRLFKINLNSKLVTRLTENNDRIVDFWLSPDGTRVVTAHARSLKSSYDQSMKPFTFLTDLKTGERRQIVTDADQPVWDVHWRRDGQGFYSVGPHTTNPRYEQPGIMEVWHYALAKGIAEKVNLNWERGLATGEILITDKGFVTLLADGVRTKPAHYSHIGDRWQREWISGGHTTNLFSLQIGGDDKTLLYQYSNASHPDQWYRATLNGAKIESPVRLTSLNPGFQTKPMGKFEAIHWQGALGETVEGLLYYPHNYQPGQKYPLVVRIHGGPASVYVDQWYDENNLLNARGAFVFRANYHGSFAYGLKWTESNIGNLNDLEAEDIEKGVDYLIGRGLVDSNKLGVIGWSNGGSLTAAITIAIAIIVIATIGPID